MESQFLGITFPPSYYTTTLTSTLLAQYAAERGSGGTIDDDPNVTPSNMRRAFSMILCGTYAAVGRVIIKECNILTTSNMRSWLLACWLKI